MRRLNKWPASTASSVFINLFELGSCFMDMDPPARIRTRTPVNRVQIYVVTLVAMGWMTRQGRQRDKSLGHVATATTL